MGRLALDYRDLDVYKLARKTAIEIQSLSKSFPDEEKYSLTDQVRRSSRSICANIAEAWRTRDHPKAFSHSLQIVESEASETRVWLDFANCFGYLTQEYYRELDDRYDHILRMLHKMRASSQAWCRQPTA
ncbi:MAG: four helix bundle protein [bacterium]|nr:four helix bundle protein [bacterium]MDT8367080.1 four helix bundle protein [bacterium]